MFCLFIHDAQFGSLKESWFGGGAEVKFYSFATEGATAHNERGVLSLPNLDVLMQTTKADERREALKKAGEGILNAWEGTEVHLEKDRRTVYFGGDTGKILFSAPAIPPSFNWNMLAIESDRDIRQLGATIDEILPDTQVDSLAAKIMTLAATGASPQITAAIAVAKMVLRGVTRVLRDNTDDQLGLVEQSWVKEMHYAKGTRVATRNPDLTGNMWYSYTLFGV